MNRGQEVTMSDKNRINKRINKRPPVVGDAPESPIYYSDFSRECKLLRVNGIISQWINDTIVAVKTGQR
jgi:hypothetical protein